MRPTRYVLLAVLTVSTSLSMATSARAADPGFTKFGDKGLMGTTGDDLLILTIGSENALSHNRFAEGDPGFESATDFDPSAAGVQTLRMEYGVLFHMGAGNDRLMFVGTYFEGNDYSMPRVYGAEGTDALDFASLTVRPHSGPDHGVRVGSSGHVSPDGFERLVTTALDDAIVLGVYGDDPYPGLTNIELGAGDDFFLGGEAGEIVDGGPGTNEIDGREGNDTVIVSPPFATSNKWLQGGNDTDILRIKGTPANDSVATDIRTGHFRIVGDPNSDLGYRATTFESVQFDLGSGDDDLYFEPVNLPVALDGGAGDDAVSMNALRYPATYSDGRFSIPGLPPVPAVGFEHPEVFNAMFVVAGALAGGSPHVRTFDAQTQIEANFYAYGERFNGGVNVATGDLDADGVDEIITAPGPGGGPHVRVFDREGQAIGPGFYAYASNFAGGVRVAAGDLDGDGADEIITAPQTSGGPHIRVFSAEGELLSEFFAKGFGNTGLTVAGGGTPSDTDEIVVGSGPGSPPLLGAFWADGTTTATPIAPFPTGFRGGVTVASFEPIRPGGAHNGIAVGAGPGGNPHVRTFTHRPAQDGNESAFEPVGSFYAFNEGFSGGVSVAGGATATDLPGAVVVGAGPGGGPHVRALSPTGVQRPLSFYAFGGNFSGGINVAASDPKDLIVP